MKLDVSYDNCPQLGSSLEIRHNLFAIWWDTLLILPWPAGIGSPQVASRAKSRREQLRAAGVVVEGRKSGWRGVSLVQALFKIRRIITSVLILSCHRKKKTPVLWPEQGKILISILISIRQKLRPD